MGTVFDFTNATVRHARTVACQLIAIAVLLGLGSGAAMAETDRVAYLPTTFKTENQPIRTTACLKVSERIYPQSAWWEDASGLDGRPERAFKAVIAAMKRKDHAALLKLTDARQGKDTKKFDQQAEAFFGQFDTMKLVAAPRAYEFDGLLVFFAKFQAGEEKAFVPMSFAYQSDGSFGFLPLRTEQLTYQLVEDWFQTKWGPSATDHPSYCSDHDIKRATHRVSLGTIPGAARQFSHSSELLFVGAPVETPKELAGMASQVKSTLEKMKSALANGTIDDFINFMAPGDGKRLKDWYASASQSERSGYKSATLKQTGQPYFLIDASPLVVTYTKSGAGVQVMYFTVPSSNELLWTNSFNLTLSDKVFKTGPLYDAALLANPFSTLAIK